MQSSSVDGGVHVPKKHKPKAASNNACENARKSHPGAVDTGTKTETKQRLVKRSQTDEFEACVQERPLGNFERN